jgi:hypothetical protein
VTRSWVKEWIVVGENNQPNTRANVAIELELLPVLHRALDVAKPLGAKLLETLRQRVAELMARLGIPGEPAVSISTTEGNSSPTREMLRLRVNGELHLYSQDLIRWLYGYVTGTHVAAKETPDALLAYLCDMTADDPGKFVEFVTLACVERIKDQPSVLLTLPGVLAYADSLPVPDGSAEATRLTRPDPAWLLPLLSETLDLKISIANRQTVANTLARAGERSSRDVGEDLIEALRPSVIEIQLTTEYLRQLTTSDDPSNKLDVFTALREDLFKESGVIFPAFRFALDGGVKPNSFAFTINHLSTLPRIGLRSDQCFVDMPPAEFEREGIPAIAAMNPDTGQIGSLIDLHRRSLADAVRRSSCNDLQYLTRALGGVLRQHSACFIDHKTVHGYLEQLSLVLPALVKAAREELSLTEITQTLRARVAQRQSIRNMRFILEQLLDNAESLLLKG